MKRENAFFEEMKRVGHAWDDERRAKLEQRREIEKTYGYCSEEYSNWLAENKDIPFPFTDGANKAYRAWAGSIQDELEILEFSDLLWDREVADFVDTLRKAGGEHPPACRRGLHDDRALHKDQKRILGRNRNSGDQVQRKLSLTAARKRAVFLL